MKLMTFLGVDKDITTRLEHLEIGYRIEDTACFHNNIY